MRFMPQSQTQGMTSEELQEAFEKPNDIPETLVLLRDVLGLSDPEIGRALAVNPRSIKRWRTGGAVADEPREAAYDLARVVAQMAELGLQATNVHAWLFRRNRFLGEQRPIDVFAANGFDGVSPAVQAYREGAYD